MQATAQQLMHTPVRQGVPNIMYTEEWYQERESDSIAYRQTSLPTANVGRYHHNTGLIPRNIGLDSSEHSVGIKSQINYNTLNKNKTAEVRHTLLWR